MFLANNPRRKKREKDLLSQYKENLEDLRRAEYSSSNICYWHLEKYYNKIIKLIERMKGTLCLSNIYIVRTNVFDSDDDPSIYTTFLMVVRDGVDQKFIQDTFIDLEDKISVFDNIGTTNDDLWLMRRDMINKAFDKCAVTDIAVYDMMTGDANFDKPLKEYILEEIVGEAEKCGHYVDMENVISNDSR